VGAADVEVSAVIPHATGALAAATITTAAGPVPHVVTIG